MGRTLSYSIKTVNGKAFTRKECESMINLSEKYNQSEDFWTCENLWIDVYNFLPNWRSWSTDGKAESQEQIENRYGQLERQGLHRIDIIKQLIKEKLVFLAEKMPNKTGGYVKVQGNELNSLAVFSGLLELSNLLPNIKIHLYDEGEFLYCPLYIQKGKVTPDVNNVKENIERWTRIIFLNSSTRVAREIRKTFPKDIDKHMTNKLFDSCYKDIAENILKKEIERYAAVVRLIEKCWTQDDVMICVYNMENTPIKHWFDPEVWHRTVDPKAFENYECSPATLMDGFKGEGFGLTDEDAEKESYRRITQMQKMFSVIEKGAELQILGEKK